MQLRQHLEAIQALSLTGYQKVYYDTLVKNFKEVSITQTKDLPEELYSYVNFTKNLVKPELRHCYRNAQLFTTYFKFVDAVCFYIEGYYLIGGVPIQHAFNMIIYGNKEYFIDITAELKKFPESITDIEYASTSVYSKQMIRNYLEAERVHSSVFDYYFRKHHENGTINQRENH